MRKQLCTAAVTAALLLSACKVSTSAVAAETVSSSDAYTLSASAINDAAEFEDENGVSEEEPEKAEPEDDFSAGLVTFQKEQQIEETVLYDQNQIKIIATGLTYSNYAVELGIRIENNTDRNMTFIAESFGYACNAVNGFMIEDGYLNCEVAAGGSAEDSICFSYTELLIHGISEIADIQVGFDIHDDEYNEIYTGPLQVKAPAAEKYDYNSTAFRKVINSKAMQYTYGYEMAAFSEEEVYSSGGISIDSEAYMINQNGERSLMLEVMNSTDSQIYFGTSNITVNNTEIYDSGWSLDMINAGCRALVDISPDDILDEDEWQTYGIEEIDNIGFTVTVMNEDGIVIAEPKGIVIEV